MLCKYRNIFGEPAKGIHSFRIFGIAIVDLVATILIAYLLTKVMDIPFWFALLFFIVLGIFQ